MNNNKYTFYSILLLALFWGSLASGQTQLGADIDGESVGDQSGYSVALDGNRLAVGAPRNDRSGAGAGHVRIFEWNGTNWAQLGADIDGDVAMDRLGQSVSMDGNRVAIGASWNSDNGHRAGQVRVFEWNGTNWAQLGADINGKATGDLSGYAISLHNNRVAIGAPFNDDNGTWAGQVRTYEWNGTNWIQLGADINGEAAEDQAGTSVSLDGNRLAIGAHLNDGRGNKAGHVRVFDWNGTNWVQLGADIDGEGIGGQSGVSVSLDGNRVAIGAYRNAGAGSNAGHTRIYDWNGTNWVQLGADIDGEAVEDFSGISVSLDGNLVAIGASANDGNGSNAGHVRIYKWDGTAWTQLGVDIDGEAAEDYSGSAVSLNSNRVAIGARLNDGIGTEAGHVRVYDLSAIITSTQRLALEEQLSIAIYPNPTANFLHINKQANETLQLSITNLQGQLLYQKDWQTNKEVVDLTQLTAGTYLLSVSNGRVQVNQTIIKR